MQGVAVVTGGGRGIGRTVAMALARAGMAVGITARSPDELAQTVAEGEACGGTAAAVVADAASPEAVRAAVSELRAGLGEITLLVNNAGANRTIGPSWEVDPDVWWSDVTVNLRGPFLFARE